MLLAVPRSAFVIRCGRFDSVFSDPRLWVGIWSTKPEIPPSQGKFFFSSLNGNRFTSPNGGASAGGKSTHLFNQIDFSLVQIERPFRFDGRLPYEFEIRPFFCEAVCSGLFKKRGEINLRVYFIELLRHASMHFSNLRGNGSKL